MTLTSVIMHHLHALFSFATVFFAVRGTLGQVEDCPQNCSPVNNNYGPACATVDGKYRSFPNLCELSKERCSNRRSGGPVIEFVRDGPCTAPVQSRDREVVSECPMFCLPANNTARSVCAAVGNDFRTFPNLCELNKQRCSSRRLRGPVIEFVKDGSCSTPVQSQKQEDQFILPLSSDKH